MLNISPFLRSVLLVDAAASGAMALLLAAGPGFLGPFLGLPVSLLFWAGVVLIPWTALLLMLARRTKTSRLLFYDVVVINALWVAASLGILVGGLVEPNLLGTAFIIAQALAVAGLAVLQLAGMRRRVEELPA
ncbi:hypothetical protein GRZ55_07105 [Chelativorans sp. ZYF759]|uniref:hypothetical protein n=1 Tax=Chelativorans sp. ZYF759 TaxID=2692213 RepID=UPI00145EBC61|nr:hypothetical protein [Chelativorans sp. ZYF759]NMG39005.1 hypothetical protein [Chelativorans sp. ZYF759]